MHSLNAKEMFTELEDFWKSTPEAAQKLIPEAADRAEEFGDSFRAFYILMKRYQRNNK
jgi:hypothetical protein